MATGSYAEVAKVFVTLDCDGKGIYVFNMKRDIVEFYQRDRISEKLVNQFKKDFNEGKIKNLCKWILWSGNLKRANLKKIKDFFNNKKRGESPSFYV